MRMKQEWSVDLMKGYEGGYPEYRIPGMVISGKGTLLCYCEGRFNHREDWGKIDLVIARSEDDGKTWERQVMTLPENRGGKADDTITNPVMIADGERIHLIFHQNYERAFCCLSVDDGKTWTLREITDTFREFPYEWNVCATGPGHGMITKEGRLIAPIWLANGAFLDDQGYKRAHEPSRAGAIYSDDHGETWHAGALVEGILDANENTVAQRADGSVLYNFRSDDGALRRTLAVSPDGVSGFSKVWLCRELPDPKCFGSMVNLSDGGILFTNCDEGKPRIREDGTIGTSGERVHVRVKLSRDDGETWEIVGDVDEVGGYSDLAVWGKSLYVFYERCPRETKIVECLRLKKYSLV